MREIKFRAWYNGEMHEWDKIKEKPMQVMEYAGKMFFMQSTGMTDKNGKEIYEGDIVKNNRHNSLAEIVWKQSEGSTAGVVKGLFGEELNLDGFIYDIGKFTFRGIDGGSTKAHYVGEFEVIGDIYTTPELLK